MNIFYYFVLFLLTLCMGMFFCIQGITKNINVLLPVKSIPEILISFNIQHKTIGGIL